MDNDDTKKMGQRRNGSRTDVGEGVNVEHGRKGRRAEGEQGTRGKWQNFDETSTKHQDIGAQG